jgi:hypothetical protein
LTYWKIALIIWIKLRSCQKTAKRWLAGFARLLPEQNRSINPKILVENEQKLLAKNAQATK